MRPRLAPEPFLLSLTRAMGMRVPGRVPAAPVPLGYSDGPRRRIESPQVVGEQRWARHDAGVGWARAAALKAQEAVRERRRAARRRRPIKVPAAYRAEPPCYVMANDGRKGQRRRFGVWV